MKRWWALIVHGKLLQGSAHCTNAHPLSSHGTSWHEVSIPHPQESASSTPWLRFMVAEVTSFEQLSVCWIDHNLHWSCIKGNHRNMQNTLPLSHGSCRLSFRWVELRLFAFPSLRLSSLLGFDARLPATLLSHLKAENLQTLCRGMCVVEVTYSGHFACLLDPNLHWRCNFGNHCNVGMNALSLLTLVCARLRISFTATLTFFNCTPQDKWLSFLPA